MAAISPAAVRAARLQASRSSDAAIGTSFQGLHAPVAPRAAPTVRSKSGALLPRRCSLRQLSSYGQRRAQKRSLVHVPKVSAISEIHGGHSASGDAAGSLRRLLLAYDVALKTRPVITKALTAAVGFALGDFIAQLGERPGFFDPFRCLRLSLYGLLVDGPVGHQWYKLLDKHVFPRTPTSLRAVLTKTAADQLLWAPVMTVVFFAFLKALEGRPDLIAGTVQSKLVKTLVANYMLWPLAHFVSFRWVPTDYRIPFNNAVSVVWNAYLSWTCVGMSSCH